MASTTTPETSPEPNRTALTLALIVAAGALLRLLALGSEDLWLDEYFTATVAQKPTLAEVWQWLEADVTPPLAYLLARAGLLLEPWLGLEAALRCPNALAGALAPLVTFQFVARRIGPVAGVSGAALLAVHTVAVHHSREARFYGLTVLLGAILFLLADRLSARWRARDGCAFGLAGAVLILTHTVGATLVAALAGLLVIGAWRSEARRERMLALAAGGAAFLLALLPCAALAAQQAGTIFSSHSARGVNPVSLTNLEWAAKTLAGVTRVPGPRIQLILFLPLTLAGGVVAWRRRRFDELLVPLLAIVAPVLLLIAFPPRHMVPGRYFLFMLPLFVLLQLRGALLLADRFRDRRRAFGVLCAALVLAHWAPLRGELGARNIPYKDAAAELVALGAPNKGRIIVHPHGATNTQVTLPDRLLLAYYAPELEPCLTDVFQLEPTAHHEPTFTVVTLKPRHATPERLLLLPPSPGHRSPRDVVRALATLDQSLPGHHARRWQAAFGRWLVD